MAYIMKNSVPLNLVLILACALIFLVPVKTISAQTQTALSRSTNSDTKCEPTPADYLGPFYKAGAPVRSRVGKGYQMTGLVISSADCTPIAKAMIELWLTGPDGSYDDYHRATTFSNDSGQYRFESNFPPGYSGRPPHIHIRVSANGFRTLATQHYPEAGQTTGEFDLVLVPIN
jgi:protocatechuate 3,4-dioxygenase beta subunit